ncbi:MAG: sulfatase [Planctomycetes bacterium]|nr:sulfatase [Planctomycetota bacterium]
MTNSISTPDLRPCAAFVAALAILLPACSPSAETPASSVTARPRHVLLVCIDAVRADRLGPYGYTKHATTPRLDALARESVVYEDATASASWTKPSVPSFLTGLHPAQHGVYEGSSRGSDGTLTDLLPRRARTLAEEFEARGYRTGGFVHNAQLHVGSGIEQGFDRYEEGNADAERLCARALEWIDEQDPGRPLFVYLHLLDAHFPYAVPEAYAKRFAEGADIEVFQSPDWRNLRDAVNHGQRALTPKELAGLEALYDGSIRYVDDQLAGFLGALEQRGLDSGMVVSVIADHGEEFLEHGKIGHGHGLHENLLRVPWILRAPGIAARREQAPVGLVDLFPTLVSAAGLELAPAKGAPNPEGLDVSRGPAPHGLFAEHLEPSQYEQAWREGKKKLVRRFVPLVADKPLVQPLESVLKNGARWEAEFDLAADGTLRATKLKPREEPPSDPLELQGRLERIDESSFRLSGRVVRTTPATELYGEAKAGTPAASLADGAFVKVVGVFVEHELHARKIKLYPTDRKPQAQVRGVVESFEGTRAAGRLRIGELDVAWDVATRWELDEDLSDDRRLERADVVPLLESGAGRAGALGLRAEVQLFDLATDPREEHPVDAPAEIARMTAELERYTAELMKRRCYRDDDRARLSTETIEKLRGIGYAR